MEQEYRTVTHYGLFKCTDYHWQQPKEIQAKALTGLMDSLELVGKKTWFYQVSPAHHKFDFLIWNNTHSEHDNSIHEFLSDIGKAVNKYKKHFDLTYNLWGVTKPSMYSKAKKSAQELDPFIDERKPYFVIYPFSKTPDWYLKSREERQEMMNEHIRIGKQYTSITQLLLYSFGMQDQEFVVAYEQTDLPLFSDLVYELRGTYARKYTLNDIPQITGLYKTKQELTDIICPK